MPLPKAAVVRWKQDRGSFLGRNGTFKCRAVEVSANQNDLYLQPITSRDLVGRCLICIPRSQAKALAKAILKVT
jgi:hypothetical protein